MKTGSTAKSVYVAMSGGVDSSVAAALLKKQGFKVTGVFMKPWQTPGVKCLWEKDREDAMRVAAVLDIPLKTWDFSKEYGRHVTKYLLDTYRRGETPNPDVMCNKEIKFGLFLQKALKEGADFIATGHYARIGYRIQGAKRRIKKPSTLNADRYTLLASRDTNKDQTYFLWTLTQEQLSRTLFPVGNMTKPEVRKLAKKYKLPTFDKKDSQGVCFIGPLHMKEFLKTHIATKPGDITDIRGHKIGKHDGMYYYTIGQRHGLDIKLGDGPYYVVSKDAGKNTIIVGTEQDLKSSEAKTEDMHFISGRPKFPLKCSAKIRYRTKAEAVTLYKDGRLKFTRPQRAVTPGQSVVFYRGQTVLGGAIISG